MTEGRVPLPEGFGIGLDSSTRTFDGGSVFLGGAPLRVLRLTTRGRDAWHSLAAGPVHGRATGLLARRLVDAGLAHPRPPGGECPPVTVVIPVRDNPCDLERCLAALDRDLPVLVVDDGSADPGAVAGVCARYAVRVVRRAVPGGPAAARNAGLASVRTDLVAFLDSDCVPSPGWVAGLAGHFADPRVGACAPRVVGRARSHPYGPEVTSPLDMGRREAKVVPMGPVPYVPTAALVVRRVALDAGFDEALRYGEDVDRVWRLIDAGWAVRYDPRVRVDHLEPRSERTALVRRFRYGTSAAPLSNRHPGRLAPAVLQPWSAAAMALLAARRPAAAAAVTATVTGTLVATLVRAGVPLRTAILVALSAVSQTVVGLGRAGIQLALPLLVLAATRGGSCRALALALLLAPPMVEATRAHRAPTAFSYVLGQAAYGLGVWRGCIRERTLAPVLPRIVRATLPRDRVREPM